MFSILKFAFAIIFSNSNGPAFVYSVIYSLSKDTILMEIYVLHHKRFVLKRLTHYETRNLVNFAVESSIAWRMRNLIPMFFSLFTLSFAPFLTYQINRLFSSVKESQLQLPNLKCLKKLLDSSDSFVELQGSSFTISNIKMKTFSNFKASVRNAGNIFGRFRKYTPAIRGLSSINFPQQFPGLPLSL